MKNFLRIFIALSYFSMPVQAQEGDIQSVIKGQLSAFQTDDMEKAFSFASNNVRSVFRTPDYFGQMVRQGYPMVHRPKSFEFQKLHEIEGSFFQQVQIEGFDGVFYVIQYAMVETDQGWKIDGVELYKTNITAT